MNLTNTDSKSGGNVRTIFYFFFSDFEIIVGENAAAYFFFPSSFFLPALSIDHRAMRMLRVRKYLLAVYIWRLYLINTFGVLSCRSKRKLLESIDREKKSEVFLMMFGEMEWRLFAQLRLQVARVTKNCRFLVCLSFLLSVEGRNENFARRLRTARPPAAWLN